MKKLITTKNLIILFNLVLWLPLVLFVYARLFIDFNPYSFDFDDAAMLHFLFNSMLSMPTIAYLIHEVDL